MAGPPRPLLVVTTIGSREEALALARAIVDLRLAACAQIEPIDSIYRWREQVYEDAEFRLLFKTIAAHYPALEAAIRARHLYDLPAIHAIATEAADPVYAAWVAENSGGADRPMPA
ncbi:divalent-cation tolerance protein CutA [Ottowia sp.]|jgi:periplasmic divalent cation tolerance protein|uniref:divalent-cation tolerance protein CutA n=1 Tax=Ottowia sp. TaxID=1898956 RepID=UPI0025DD1E51|nr:divalent-cation tolerance protein CutA [Ottowia sp.]MBK6614813.1 divalent-cation tolerance protein CutA [Ottowia sp.]MBK6745898.1 divalent-cation tolerance protein CutA [Ottowia sp.]